MKLERPHEQVFLYTLDNGVRVIMDERTTKYMDLTSMCGSFYVGCQDDGEKPGISHFLEHVVAQDSAGYTKERKAAIDKKTGFYSYACTNYAYTRYSISNILPENRALATDVLCKTIFQPCFRPKQIEEERTRIISEIWDAPHREPNYRKNLAKRKVIWNGHALVGPVLAEENEVQAIARNDLLKHYHDQYTLDNLVFSVIGACDHDKVLTTIEKQAEGFQQSNLKQKIAPPTFRSAIEIFPNGHPSNASVEIYFPGLSCAQPYKEWDVYKVLNDQISSDTSSLNRSMLYKAGLYGVQHSHDAIEHMGVDCFTFNTSIDNLGCALDVLADEISKLKVASQYSRKALLNKVRIAKEYKNQDLMEIAADNAISVFRNDAIFRTDAQGLKALAKVARKDVCAMAQRLYSEKPTILIETAEENKNKLPDLEKFALRFVE